MKPVIENEQSLRKSPFPESDLRTLLEFFYQWEKEKPNEIFLRQPRGARWETHTWSEAGMMARRLVTALRDQGLEAGDKVGLVSKNCYHWIIADLAIMMGGFVSTPFYPNLTAGQLRQVLRLSQAKALFVGKLDEWEEMKVGVPDDIPIIRFPHYEGNARVTEGQDWNELLERYEPVEGNPKPGLHDLWTIIFTSGTTGLPKGVMLDYYAPSALLHNERINNNLRIFEGTDHRFFSYLPLNHIAERVIVEIAAIITGGTISFAESLDTFAKNLQETAPTLFMAVPRIWTKFQLAILERLPQKRLELLLKVPLVASLIRRKIKKGLGLASARILLTGAAPTPDVLKEWYRRLGLTLLEVYAMTENTGGCTLMPSDDIRPGTVGKPLPNVELKIDQETGEVLMRAPWVMQGYYGDEEKTAHVLRDGWLHTGDQGDIDGDGYLRLTGRVSDTFKSAKGKYIVPAPIEWGFAKNTFIEQVAVVGLAIPQPLALVVLSELGLNAERTEVIASLQQTLQEVNASLPNYERLKAVIIVKDPWAVDNGILTPTMKIRRDVLNQRYQEYFQLWYDEQHSVIWEK